jgi:hypothetical protein
MRAGCILVALLVTTMSLDAQESTRGIGIYPGDRREDFAPVLEPDATTYRNVALRRPAFHSSAHDYNLTAQLVTDGIKDARAPRWIVVSTSKDGVLARHKREWIADDNWVSTVDLPGPSVWVQLDLGGGDEPLEIDRVDVETRVESRSPQPENWTITVQRSDDGNTWTDAGRASGMSRSGGDIAPSISLAAPSRSRSYRIVFDDPRAVTWRVSEIRLARKGQPVRIGGPYDFTSAWKSAGSGEEWVYVDLGAHVEIDRVALHWTRRAATGAIQVSDEAKNWKTVQDLPGGSGPADEVKLAQPVKARYVRVLMTKAATSDGYILSELEVFGRGGVVAKPHAMPAQRADGRLDLAGGGWRVQRESQVKADGRALSTPGFAAADWVVATVPGTVLTSYFNAGAVPDPNFGDNQLMISDAFFHADFWYRNEFTGPALAAGRRAWLIFDGINWKAEVFLNGERLGRIDGGFIRGRFDVTSRLRPGRPNALAVRIEKQASPGSVKEKTFENPDKNGGWLGADNPTYHASIGWDWIPTIRGRNTGIWNDVYISSTGSVTVEDPLVTTALPLPDTTSASVTIQATVRNATATAVTGTLRGRFGDARFETPVTVGPSSAQNVKLDPSTHAALRLANPKLWWPAGYGDPNLYDVELEFVAGGAVSDAKAFKAGVRQFTYSEEGGTLRMWINGRRFVARGGNWGFGESMLRYRGREYDAAMRYHADMHFNMVRNWVGQIGDEEFYEAADRHGIVIWQDFWLANPWDGPDPGDDGMFMSNATDMVQRIRSHASVGLYCGRNEGYPPKPLDDAIRAMLAKEHPGLHYISSSADDVASGHGPYRAMPVNFYFSERATRKMHSELGMPNIVTMDSLRLMMNEADMWPQGRLWGLHDFCLGGAQGGTSYIERIEKSYGPVKSAEEWVGLAQFVNYEGYRAMFEAQSRNRMGLLIWMSHPAWPSFVWQTYDWYLEPTAAYFGAKKASEPLHVQWNPVDETVEVVNYSAGSAKGLTVQVRILNVDGALQWEKSAPIDSAEDSTVAAFRMEYPAGLTAVHFLKLRLTRGTEVVSENFYWRGAEAGDFRAIRNLPKVALETTTNAARDGDRWRLTTTLRNTSTSPALMVRLKAVRERTRDRILPVLYEDNYVSLMPGESRTIVTEVRDADARGERPAIEVEGFNVATPRSLSPRRG